MDRHTDHSLRTYMGPSPIAPTCGSRIALAESDCGRPWAGLLRSSACLRSSNRVVLNALDLAEPFAAIAR